MALYLSVIDESSIIFVVALTVKSIESHYDND
jgi:hypothetical protein